MNNHALIFIALLLAGCQSLPHPPLAQAAHVDLPRFMGDWYVIAHIPPSSSAMPTMRWNPTACSMTAALPTTFSFNDGGFDGKRRTYTPTGFVLDSTSNAVWGMRFIWPIKADYRIVYLDADYRQTVIGREKA